MTEVKVMSPLSHPRGSRAANDGTDRRPGELGLVGSDGYDIDLLGQDDCGQGWGVAESQREVISVPVCLKKNIRGCDTIQGISNSTRMLQKYT